MRPKEGWTSSAELVLLTRVASHYCLAAQGTEKFGFNVDAHNNITYREWAPNATQAFLIGEFSISHLLSQVSFTAATDPSQMSGTGNRIP
jgi:hypothetical protein